MIYLLLIFLFTFISATGYILAQEMTDDLPSCEWCGANEAPKNISWKTTIPDKDEPGEPLIISGTIYKSDKKTPAPDVILYIYHTNSRGIYPKRGNETGNGKRHGYLRSWIRTNDKGKFQFTTIRPGSYPNTTAPQHIHMTVKEPGKEEYYINTVFFADDPFITEREHKSGDVLTLSKNETGIWTGEHNIVLKN